MAYGRSFRGRVRDGLVRTGRRGARGLRRMAGGRGPRAPQGRPAPRRRTRWEARLDGSAVRPAWASCAPRWPWSPSSPAATPWSPAAAKHRRRFLDWGLFHVEPEFLPLWRRYARALKQRNALLKAGAGDAAAGRLGPRAGRGRRTASPAAASATWSSCSRASPAMAADLLPALGDDQPGVPARLAPRRAAAGRRPAAGPRARPAPWATPRVGPHRADWRHRLRRRSRAARPCRAARPS